MFGRVSTVDFSNYINRRIFDTDSPIRMGVVPAKKWTGALSDKFSEYQQQQIESGWIEVREEAEDEYGYAEPYTFYPEYSQPADKKLPDFVNLYREEDGKPSFSSFRTLIGEGTSSVGPFTLPEALYVYSVTKKFKPEITNLNEYTASAGEVSSSMSGVTSSDQDWNTADSNSPPISLFTSYQKNYINFYGRDLKTFSNPSTGAGTVSESGNSETFISTSYDWLLSPFSFGVTPNQTFIAIDIDKPEDYYIGGLGFYLNIECRAGMSAVRSSTGTTGSATSIKILRKIYHLKSRRYIDYYSFDALSEVGQTSGDWTYVKIPFTYDFGNEITKQHNLYGVIEDVFDEYSSGDNPPPVSASVSFPTPDYNPKAIEFWPYKNASGQPVYNTTTGAIVNDPIP